MPLLSLFDNCNTLINTNINFFKKTDWPKTFDECKKTVKNEMIRKSWQTFYVSFI